MTMGNPYAPQGLASTMGPAQSTMPPLVLAPESLSQAGVPLGEQAPTLTQPGPVGPMGAPLPPPTVADPAAMTSAAPPPPPPASMAPNAAMDAPPPVPTDAGPPLSMPPPPDANMTSAATGAPVTAPPPATAPPSPTEVPTAAASTEPAPAPKPVPKSMTPAGNVGAIGQIGTLNRDLGKLQRERSEGALAYEGRTSERADQFLEDADGIVRTRNLQNSTDAFHVAKAKELDDAATAKADTEWNEIQQLSKQVGEMKVDPKAALPKGLGGGILAVLGSMIGAIGQAYGSGPNQFTAMMNHAIDTQMRADEANIANAKGALGNRISLYGLMRQNSADKRQAAAAYRKNAWDYAENQINALKEKTTNRDQLQRYDSMLQGVEKERLAQEIDYKTGRKNELVAAVTRDQAARAAAEQRLWDRKVEIEKLNIERMKAGKEAKSGQYADHEEERKRRATYSPGFKGYVSNPEGVKDANYVATATDNAVQAAERLLHLMAKGNRLSKADTGQMKQAARVLAIGEKDRNKLGALTDSDWGLMPIKPEDVEKMFRDGDVASVNELILFLKGQKANYRRNNITLNRDMTPNEDTTGTIYIPDMEDAGQAEAPRTREAPPPKGP